MNQTAPSSHLRGLHDRAVSTLLELFDQSSVCIPTLTDVAAMLAVPEARLRQMFPDADTLAMAAIEQSLVVLMDDSSRAVVQVDPNDPVAQFQALGDAYLEWAARHPTEFRLMSDPRRVDMLRQPSLRRYVNGLSDLMGRLLQRAIDRGQMHPRENVPMLVLSARTYAYGVASMIVDNRLEAWVPGADQLTMGKRLTHDFIARMARSSVPVTAV